MRAIIQRVSAASVTGMFNLAPNAPKVIVLSISQAQQITSLYAVNNEMISQISQGLMVLVGIGTGMS